MKFDATPAQVGLLVRHLAHLPGSQGVTHETLEHELPRGLLERYDWLQKVGHTPPLVALEHGACSGCHIRLPTMFASHARLRAGVHTCPHCQRLLYIPEAPVEEPAPPPQKPPRPARRPRVGGRPRA